MDDGIAIGIEDEGRAAFGYPFMGEKLADGVEENINSNDDPIVGLWTFAIVSPNASVVAIA